MRALTKEEIELVAGGYQTGWSSGTRMWTTFFSSAFFNSGSGGAITVHGYRNRMSPSSFFYDYHRVPTGGDTGDGGTPSPPPPPPPLPEPKDTPCVAAKNAPTAASMHDINQQALIASNEIAAGNDETYEFASIMYVKDGVVSHTDPITQKLEGNIDWNPAIAKVPDGATIVGILHNHPDIAGINDTIPSPTSQGGRDWAVYNQFLTLNTRGIHTDPNLLQYIYSNEDGKTHVYDKSDKETTNAQCSLQ